MKFHGLKMDLLREHPRKYLRKVDCPLREIKRVRRPVDEKDIGVAITLGQTSEYDTEARLLERSAKWPDRNRIERTILNENERLEGEKTVAGSHALVTTNSGSDRSASFGVLCSIPGQDTSACGKVQVIARNRQGTKLQPPAGRYQWAEQR